MQGNLTSTGFAETVVGVLWGTTDGETNMTAWANTNWFSPHVSAVPAAYATNLTTLTEHTTYFYTFCASNAFGLHIPGPSKTFVTSGDVWIEASTPLTTELGGTHFGDPGVFTIHRPDNNGTNPPLTVYYTVSGTAINGTDYETLSGTATIPNAMLSVPVNVLPIPDDLHSESNENVILTLSPDAGYTIGSAVADEVVITNAIRVPAFPGAEGVGKWATGGRGGDVYIVTNLDDSGPGSLREAIEASGPRTVVFEVSGTINLESDLAITNSDITIAGQTAPGDGICLKGATFRVGGFNKTRNKLENVIIRYIRSRPGSAAGGIDALSVYEGNHVIVDHCSLSWSEDETLSVSVNPKLTPLKNITIQWCIASESVGGSHGYATLTRSHHGSQISYHHNLLAHHLSRVPRPGNYEAGNTDPEGMLLDFRNNVIYNWGNNFAGYNSDDDEVSRYNVVNNYYVKGVNSGGGIVFDERSSGGKSWFAGNYYQHSLPADPWSLVSGANKNGSEFVLDEPIPAEAAPDSYTNVLAHAGASFVRDAVDTRIVSDVVNTNGSIISNEGSVGGWPTLNSIDPPDDTDRDGMPDAWETANGFNPNDPSDRNGDANTNGYSNLEEYINGLLDRSELIVQVDGSRGGTLDPSGDVIVPYGGSTSVLIMADTFWDVGEILLDEVTQPATNVFLLNNVMSNHSLSVTFDPDLTTTTPTPHWWLDAHGFSDFESAVTNDTDGDGMAAWAEYIAGTDPTNAASFFGIMDIISVNGTNILKWLGGDTNLPPYKIYVSTNLMETSAGFTLLTSNVVRSATGTNVWSETAPSDGPQRFYRIEAVD